MTRKLISAALAMAAVLLWATPAQAFVTSSLHDGFEASPTNWTLENSGDGVGEIDYVQSWAQTGVGSAWIAAEGAGQFSSVGRPVTLAITGRTCTLSASFFPLSFISTVPNLVNIEVINPTNWTYIAVATRRVSQPSVWQTESVSWSPSLINIYIRFSVLGVDGRFIQDQVDDAYVTCST